MSFYTDNSVALKETSLSIWKHNNNLRLLLLVEQERDLLQPRPYWKEFRFDLTPLPQGETVTAAEFRIYKTLTMGQRANRTLHISVYEIHKENRHRWRTVFFLVKRGNMSSSQTETSTQILTWKPIGVAALTMTCDTAKFKIMLDSSSLLLQLFWLLGQLDVDPELLFCPLQW